MCRSRSMRRCHLKAHHCGRYSRCLPIAKHTLTLTCNTRLSLRNQNTIVCQDRLSTTPREILTQGVGRFFALQDPDHGSVKSVALSTFPRCAHIGMPAYGNRGSPGGQDNTCLDVERTSFTWMGYTMRTDRYRYTEYVVWNGTTLSPVW
jgi:hypothetical protein